MKTDWIDANGVSLRYRLEGEGDHLVVLLHEMGGCLESWSAVTALLPDIRTLAFDARGAGMSEKPVGAICLADLVADLAGLLDALAITEPVVLVGCAVGAAVALGLATAAPHRMAGLVLLAPATGIAPEKRAETLALADRLERDGVRERMLERFDGSYPEQYFVGRDDRTAVRARLLMNDPHSYAAMYRMLCNVDLADAPEALALPVAIAAGQHDGTRPPARVGAFAHRIAGADFSIIEAGHAMHIHVPQAVVALIRSLLRRLDEQNSTKRTPLVV